MASLEYPLKTATITEFGIAYDGWRRLQLLSDEAIGLPPGPEVEELQNSAFEACERAERTLLRLTPRSDDDAVALIEVLLGNEEVAALGGPTLRLIQAYLSTSPGPAIRGRRTLAASAGRRGGQRIDARLR